MFGLGCSGSGDMYSRISPASPSLQDAPPKHGWVPPRSRDLAVDPKLPPSRRTSPKHGQSQRSAIEGTCPRQGSKPGRAKTPQAAWFTRARRAGSPARAARPGFPTGRADGDNRAGFRSKVWRRKARRAGRNPGKTFPSRFQALRFNLTIKPHRLGRGGRLIGRAERATMPR